MLSQSPTTTPHGALSIFHHKPELTASSVPCALKEGFASCFLQLFKAVSPKLAEEAAVQGGGVRPEGHTVAGCDIDSRLDNLPLRDKVTSFLTGSGCGVWGCSTVAESQCSAGKAS